MDEANEWKMLCYKDLRAKMEQQDWKATVCPVEVCCHRFNTASSVKLLKIWGFAAEPCAALSKKYQGLLSVAASGYGSMEERPQLGTKKLKAHAQV